MDQETVSHYDRDASAIAARYETADMGAIHEYLLRYLPKGGEVLELGSGSGREAAYVLQEGYDVTGIDASAGMVKESIRLHPELQNRGAYGARHSISPVIRRETPSVRLSHFVSGTRFVSRWTTFAGRECFRRGHPDTRKNCQEFIIA